jgi:hypothetical protein
VRICCAGRELCVRLTPGRRTLRTGAERISVAFNVPGKWKETARGSVLEGRRDGGLFVDQQRQLDGARAPVTYFTAAHCGRSSCCELLRTAADCCGLLRTAADCCGLLQKKSCGAFRAFVFRRGPPRFPAFHRGGCCGGCAASCGLPSLLPASKRRLRPRWRSRKLRKAPSGRWARHEVLAAAASDPLWRPQRRGTVECALHTCVCTPQVRSEHASGTRWEGVEHNTHALSMSIVRAGATALALQQPRRSWTVSLIKQSKANRHLRARAGLTPLA